MNMNPVKLAACIVFASAALYPVTSRAQSQAEMNREAGKSFETADAELNKVYKEFSAKIDKESQEKLKATQKAWVVFRDAEADLVADFDARGGSMAPMIREGCRAALTKERTAALRKLMKEYGQ